MYISRFLASQKRVSRRRRRRRRRVCAASRAPSSSTTITHKRGSLQLTTVAPAFVLALRTQMRTTSRPREHVPLPQLKSIDSTVANLKSQQITHSLSFYLFSTWEVYCFNHFLFPPLMCEQCAFFLFSIDENTINFRNLMKQEKHRLIARMRSRCVFLSRLKIGFVCGRENQ